MMKEITIGRTPGNDIVIEDPSVSRSHAVLVVNNGSYTIRDLNSTNGTFVNGQRVQQSRQLEITDIIKVGSTILPWRNYVSAAPEPLATTHKQTFQQAQPAPVPETTKSGMKTGWIIASIAMIVGALALIFFLNRSGANEITGTWYSSQNFELDRLDLESNGNFTWESMLRTETGTWQSDEETKMLTLNFDDSFSIDRKFEYEVTGEKMFLTECDETGERTMYVIELNR